MPRRGRRHRCEAAAATTALSGGLATVLASAEGLSGAVACTEHAARQRGADALRQAPPSRGGVDGSQQHQRGGLLRGRFGRAVGVRCARSEPRGALAAEGFRAHDPGRAGGSKAPASAHQPAVETESPTGFRPPRRASRLCKDHGKQLPDGRVRPARVFRTPVEAATDCVPL